MGRAAAAAPAAAAAVAAAIAGVVREYHRQPENNMIYDILQYYIMGRRSQEWYESTTPEVKRRCAAVRAVRTREKFALKVSYEILWSNDGGAQRFEAGGADGRTGRRWR